MAPHLVDELQFSGLRAVLTRINRMCQREHPTAVVFMGDFTDKGSIEWHEQALRHLTLLCRPRCRSERRMPLLFVPGNHDVNRDEARELGPIQKFERLRELAEKYKWQSPPLNEPIVVKISNLDGTSIDTLLINTAIGSWEIQNLPSFLQSALSDESLEDLPIDLGSQDESDASRAIPQQSGSREPTNRFDQYYGQLDTPYISKQMLSRLLQCVGSIDSEGACIVVGHHNILPQKTPRIAAYSELLNGGYFRRQLLEAGKTIVYLHGHIHQDPIEIISDPKIPRSKIISISAPMIQDGFNEISLFVDKRNRLLAMRVVMYRVKDGQMLEYENQEQVFIPIAPPGRALIDSDATKVLEALRAARRSSYYWSEVAELLEEVPFDSNQLEEALIALQAAQLIEIDGLGKSTRDWRIKLISETV